MSLFFCVSFFSFIYFKFLVLLLTTNKTRERLVRPFLFFASTIHWMVDWAEFPLLRFGVFCFFNARLHVRAKFPTPSRSYFFVFHFTSSRESQISHSFQELFFVYLFHVFTWEPNFPLLPGVFFLFFPYYFSCLCRTIRHR